ncbi:protein disulfide isomerase [Anaeramoeba flamelloides]|uniref:protein disulfide-isomerase n=1 Tax=Anaeramoeba flamelloides TaxID=1746091 RepID=A0ABQ8XTZ4_9EUKA|nr:protein disulfide isomerase [Anaeramoeba flamelloides]
MKFFFYLSIFLVLSFAWCNQENTDNETAPKTENEATQYTHIKAYRKITKEKKDFVFLITSEVVPTSREFEKTFLKLVKPYQEDESPLEFHIFDFKEEHQFLLVELRFIALPAIFFFRDGEVSDTYKGNGDEQSFGEWLEKIHLPLVSEIEKTEEIEAFKNQYLLVVFVEHTDDEKIMKKINDLAKNSEYSNLVFVSKKGEENTLTLFRQYDSKEIIFDGEWKKKVIGKFLIDNQKPFCQKLTRENFEMYYKMEDGVVAYLFIEGEKEKEEIEGEFVSGEQYPTNVLINQLSEEFYGKVWIAWNDVAEVQKFAEKYLFESYPGLVITEDQNSKYYRYEGEWNLEDIKSWLNSYLAGELKPATKSQPIPETNDGLIKRVVRKNWEEIVNDKTKDVFLNIYAEWSSPSKKFEQTYKELAQKLSKSKNLIIAEIDGHNNDLGNGVTFANYPTQFFFPANDKNEFIKYKAERTVEEMIKFLKENCKTAEIIAEEVSEKETVEETEEETESIKEL